MKEILILITLALITYTFTSCGEEHAMKSILERQTDSLAKANDTKLEIVNYDNFYGCVWLYGKNDNAIVKKYGKKKYDELKNKSMDLVALATTGHITTYMPSLKKNAKEIDKALNECGIAPTSYFCICRMQAEDTAMGQKAEVVFAIVGNSKGINRIIDDTSFHFVNE